MKSETQWTLPGFGGTSPLDDDTGAARPPGLQMTIRAENRASRPATARIAHAVISRPDLAGCGFARDAALSSPEVLVNYAPSSCDLIEGDNLPSLTALATNAAGTIDVIFIDPPYNTGATWFAYDDRAEGRGAAARHDAWVAFMRERLVIARTLLSNDGAIFISIDDHEQARLRLLCDEIFGEEHFVAQFVWHKTRKGKALNRTARLVTEYVLCFAKDRARLTRRGMLGLGADPSVPNPFFHRPNAPRDIIFPSGVIETNWTPGKYPAGLQGSANDSLSAEVLEPFEVASGRIATPLCLRGRFRWQQSTLDEQIATGTRFSLRKGKFRIVFYRDTGHKAPSTLLDDRCGVGTYEEASAEVTALLGELPFVYPKPVSLVRFLVRAVVHDRPEATILDFFAGTGTTGHAVAALNGEDGGRRRCILMTDNTGRDNTGFVADGGEQGICRGVCRPRLLAAFAALSSRDEVLSTALSYWRLV